MADTPITECPQCRIWQSRYAELEARVRKLEAIIEDLRRGGKRQSAPFSKGTPKPDPKPPGRKPGDAYGPKAFRAPPESIDETVHADLPPACPKCHGTHIREKETAEQFQTDVPREPICRKIIVHIGECADCGCRVQGRHPFQTSDALGAAASQIGPNAQALAVDLNKTVGASHGKIARLFRGFYNLPVDRSASVGIILRAGRRAEPVYRKILRHVRRSPYVCADETGWRIGGHPAWLWDFVTPEATAYVIDPRRNADVALAVLGPDYSGTIGHDGWRIYNVFSKAAHQSCFSHFLVRCDELLETATRGAVRFPRDLKALLQDALALRDRRDADRLSPHGLAIAIGRLDARLDRLLAWPRKDEANERFAVHLLHNQGAIFTFLHIPGVEATNWRAEQGIRPAVVNRKVWGGNRTPTGAKAQAILTSVLRTCAQQGRDAFDFLSRLLRTPAGRSLPRLNLCTVTYRPGFP
jgi:transposase